MNVFSLWLTHAVALTLKETRQILRDKSAILLGVFMTFLVSKILSQTILKGVPSSFTLDHFVWLRAFF